MLEVHEYFKSLWEWADAYQINHTATVLKKTTTKKPNIWSVFSSFYIKKQQQKNLKVCLEILVSMQFDFKFYSIGTILTIVFCLQVNFLFYEYLL